MTPLNFDRGQIYIYIEINKLLSFDNIFKISFQIDYVTL